MLIAPFYLNELSLSLGFECDIFDIYLLFLIILVFSLTTYFDLYKFFFIFSFKLSSYSKWLSVILFSFNTSFIDLSWSYLEHKTPNFVNVTSGFPFNLSSISWNIFIISLWDNCLFLLLVSDKTLFRNLFTKSLGGYSLF